MMYRGSASNMSTSPLSALKKIDVNFTIIIFVLNFIGLVNLYSATQSPEAVGLSRLFSQQIFWLTMGWIIYLVITVLDYQIWTRFAFVFYVINVIALALVGFVGKSFYGAQRWLDLGFFRYQPSETMKLALILVLAKILAQRSSYNGLGLRELAYPALLTAIPFALVVKQPDLGTALLLLGIFASMVIFVRVKRSILAAAGLILLISVPMVWNFGLKTYQKNRVLTFIDPGRDPRGTGYNSIQSKIAVGSGQFAGKGFQKGTQSQLEFLPERHTDFIFSVLSEEFGFFGSLSTFILFLILFTRSIETASQAREKTGALIVVGVLSYLFFHVIVNIGMVIGLMPIVGVPLPLLSYGGSSLLTTMLGLGLISSVYFRRYLF